MPNLAGTSGVKFTPTGTMTSSGSGLASWSADESQKMRIVSRSYAAMEVVFPPVAPPSDVVYVKRVSVVYPAPTLDAAGRPVNWVPTSQVTEDWGRLQVIMNGVDVSYYRNIPAQVKNWVKNEPFGFARADIGFPQISPMEGLPPFLGNWVNVDIRLVRPNGSVKNLWLGMFADEEDALSSGGSGLSAQLIGALYQADLYHMPPSLTPNHDIDIGQIIHDELDPAKRPNLRTLPVAGPLIGRNTKSGGSWDSLLTGYIQGLLDQTVFDGGDGNARQWTISMSGRQPVLRVKDRDTIHWRMRCGQPGITHQLSRDFTMLPNTIFGEGVDAAQCHWRNTKYPNLHLDDAPVFPGTLLGPGHSGDGVGTYEQELFNNGYGVNVDDYYDPGEEGVIQQFQADAGLQVDGVVGPQTWSAIFETGSNSGDLSGAFFMPVYGEQRVERWLYNASGGKIGLQPLFEPGAVRVERYENFGNYIEKGEGYYSAAQEALRDGSAARTPGYFGTLILEADPNEGSRFEIEEGQNFLLQSHKGVDRKLHIAQVDVDWEARKVSLTVDERARDMATMANILNRDRENHDPARRRVTHRNSKQIEDRRAQWDCENGSGVIPRHATYSELWNVLRIAAGEVGTIVRSEFTLDIPAMLSVAIFDRPTTHQILTDHGTPFDDGYWDSFPEDSGLIVAWGQNGQMGGFYPGQESNEDDPLTGRLVDDGSWYFQTTYPPWLWVAIFVESPQINYCTGRLFAGVND